MFKSGETVPEGNYKCLLCGEIITMPLPMEDFTLPVCPRCKATEFMEYQA